MPQNHLKRFNALWSAPRLRWSVELARLCYRCLLVASLVGVLLAGVSIMASGQTAARYAEMAQEAIAMQRYDKAIPLLEEAIDRQQHVYSWQFDLAESYQMVYEYELAAKWYKEVFRAKEEDFPLARFHYAECQKTLGYYDRAASAYRFFYRKNKLNPELNYWLRKAREEAEYCQLFAEKLPIDQSISLRLLTQFNAEWSEYHPVIIDSLFMWGSYQPDTLTNQFHYALLATSMLRMNDAAELDTLLLDQDYVYSFSQGRTQEEVFFSRCPAPGLTGKCRLFRARFHQGQLSDWEAFPEIVNDSLSDTRHPALARVQDKNYLLFSSNRSGGQGGFDLYAFDFEQETVWNLGETLNSPDDEVTPFYHAPDATLFFSSTRHGSLGGFDIFRSYTDLSLYFAPPQNLESPINSSYDEIFFSLNPHNPDAYFVSNRPTSAAMAMNCCYDIYSYTGSFSLSDSIQSLKELNVRMAYRNQIIQEIESLTPFSLYFDNDEPDPGSSDSSTLQSFASLLQTYLSRESIYIERFAEGLRGARKAEAEEEVSLFFEEDVRTGEDRLQELVQKMLVVLREGIPVELYVKAYASPLNTEEYNLLLSKRRIASVRNFLHKYNSGSYRPFLESGLLRLVEVPMGETDSASEVSDDRANLRESVYAPRAARERRIEIIAVEVRD